MGSGRIHLYMLDFLIFMTLRRRSLKERFPEVKSMLLAWLPEAEATTRCEMRQAVFRRSYSESPREELSAASVRQLVYLELCLI
jgi:hypothetical protein